jgi:transposase
LCGCRRHGLWERSIHDLPLGPAADQDRLGVGAATVGSPPRAGRRPDSGAGGAGGRRARRDLGRPLSAVGGTTGGAAGALDHEQVAARTRVHAHKKTLLAREQDPVARAAWRAVMASADPATLVVLDETGTPTTLTPLRARRRRGQRALGRVPRDRGTTVTVVATLTPAGLGPGLQFPGARDRQAFARFGERILVPTVPPGQTVVLDNLSVPKRAPARDLIATAGCRLVFLPTSSPDFNPIALALSQRKHLLRTAEARTLEGIFTATHQHDAQITAADARSSSRAAGYNL